MKKNEFAQLHNLSIDQLRAKEFELRQELMTQRLNKATKPAKDNQSAKKLRRNIARVLTVMHLKQTTV